MIKISGIKEARDLIKRRRHKGIVIAKGKTINEEDFMIIELKNGAYQLAIDYGSDVQFQKGIKKEDEVKLKIIDNYSAEWQKAEE